MKSTKFLNSTFLELNLLKIDLILSSKLLKILENFNCSFFFNLNNLNFVTDYRFLNEFYIRSSKALKENLSLYFTKNTKCQKI